MPWRLYQMHLVGRSRVWVIYRDGLGHIFYGRPLGFRSERQFWLQTARSNGRLWRVCVIFLVGGLLLLLLCWVRTHRRLSD